MTASETSAALARLSALVVPDYYEPKAVFSPSGLERWRRCARAGGYRYLLGIKRPEVEWATIEALPVPPAADYDARRAYNRLARPALGKACHAHMQGYYEGANVDWDTRIGQIMLPGLVCIPHPTDCDTIDAEGEVTIEFEGIRFRGYRDLLVQTDEDAGSGHNGWLLVDHKTTYTFDWIDREKTLRSVKTPEQLEADTQSNLYAFGVMQELGLGELDCRWVYYRTEGDPAALPVDFTISRQSAESTMRALAAQAVAIKGYINNALATRGPDGKLHMANVRAQVEALPANTEACEDFAGCEYHASRGGPCTAVARPSELARRTLEKRKLRAAMATLPPVERPRARCTRATKERDTMGFRDDLNKKRGAKASEAVEAEAKHEEVEPVAAEAEAPEAPAEPQPAPPAASAPKPRAPKAKPASSNLSQLAATLTEAEAAFEAAKVALREALG